MVFHLNDFVNNISNSICDNKLISQLLVNPLFMAFYVALFILLVIAINFEIEGSHQLIKIFIYSSMFSFLLMALHNCVIKKRTDEEIYGKYKSDILNDLNERPSQNIVSSLITEE